MFREAIRSAFNRDHLVALIVAAVVSPALIFGVSALLGWLLANLFSGAVAGVAMAAVATGIAVFAGAMAMPIADGCDFGLSWYSIAPFKWWLLLGAVALVAMTVPLAVAFGGFVAQNPIIGTFLVALPCAILGAPVGAILTEWRELAAMKALK